MKPRVSIVRLQGSIEDAVRKAVELLGGMGRFVEGDGSYLLKPNLFTTRTPEQGATTDMAIVLTLAEMVKELGSEPVVGECPAMASYTRPDIVFDGLGVRGRCEEAGVGINVLDREEPVRVESPDNEVLKEIWFPRYALECGGIINVPKLKSHTLTTLTCAVKNLFGLQQGGTKAHLHVATGNQPERFSRLLVDIYASIRGRIRLNVVDAVIAMEGDGPTTGDPVELGLIIAGEDAAAVDLVASSVIGWDPMDVGTVLIAAERGFGPSSLEEVEIVGEPVEVVRRRLRKPRTQMDGQAFMDIRMPLVCSVDRCTGCGICATVCPGKAITVEGTPQIDDDLCIQCFCCVELCPSGALRAIRPPD